MSRTVGRVLGESLIAHGIDTIWMVPGESFLGLTDALTETPEVRLIVCRHEGGAGFMAVADGRMQGGRAGVLLVSRGPGLSNAMVALHTAYHDATPLVVLCGQVERKDFGRLALQEQNYAKLLSDVTKDVILLTDEFRNVVGVQGLRFNPGVTFDPSKFVIYRHMPLFDNPTGMSDLRAVYSRWWMLDTVLKLRAVGLEASQRLQPN